MISILIVDNETGLAERVRTDLAGDRYRLFTASTGSDALQFLRREKVDIAILDLALPDMDGVDLLHRVKASHPLVEVIMIIGGASVDAAVSSMKLGAYDCLVKPVHVSLLLNTVFKVCETKYRGRNVRRAAGEGRAASAVDDRFVGKSRQIRDLRKQISLVAPSDTPVLILGETGSGKELAARAVHRASDRCGGPFVTVNASTLPENILESELFGHKKGAFTGAESDKTGLLETAHHGTFFIDEVGDMHPSVQAKLLRVIETGTFRKLGDTREIRVDVRIVSATNKDLEEESGRKTFRADLFYRLSAFIIRIPPLRERKKDIPLLADYFLSEISRGGPIKSLSSRALDRLTDYPWPGNVRELVHVLERAVLLSEGEWEIGVDKLPFHVLETRPCKRVEQERATHGGNVLLEDAERQYIRDILGVTEGNKSLAAKLLGISRGRLYRRLYEW